MRTFVIAASLLASACAFEPGDYSEGDRPMGGNSGTGTGTGSGNDPTVTRRTCEFDSTTLKLCLDFEDSVFDPMVTDASPTRLDSPTTQVGKVTRQSGTKVAAVFNPVSHIDVPESMALDIPGSLTIEMWVHPLAFNVQATLLNNAGQYRLSLDTNERVVCTIGGITATSDDDADPFQWNHVACVYDGSSVRVFVDGDLSAQVTASSGAPITGGTGTRIGGTYGGQLDDIRIYAGALALTDICTHAGRTSCSGTVIDGGGSGPGGD